MPFYFSREAWRMLGVSATVLFIPFYRYRKRIDNVLLNSYSPTMYSNGWHCHKNVTKILHLEMLCLENIFFLIKLSDSFQFIPFCRSVHFIYLVFFCVKTRSLCAFRLFIMKRENACNEKWYWWMVGDGR